jgi:hypothetical protein
MRTTLLVLTVATVGLLASPFRAEAQDNVFSGFYVGAETGSQNIIGGALVDVIDYLAQESRAVIGALGGLRYQFDAGIVIGVEGSYGWVDGDLSLSDPANGLTIDYANRSQYTYGLIAGYALGAGRTWLLFGYANEVTRTFDDTIVQFGTRFTQQDEQGMLRFGVGAEKQMRGGMNLRASIGTGRADFGDKDTNITVDNKLEFGVGAAMQF